MPRRGAALHSPSTFLPDGDVCRAASGANYGMPPGFFGFMQGGRRMRHLKRLNAYLNDSLVGDAIGCACLFGMVWLVLVFGWVLQ